MGLYGISYAAASAVRGLPNVELTHCLFCLLQVEALVRHFRNAKFLLMIRNPYAAY